MTSMAMRLLVQTMKDLAKGPTDKDFHKELADASLKIAEEAVRAEKPQLALQHLELIEAIARRLKNTDLLKKTTTRRAEITEVQKLVASVKGRKRLCSRSRMIRRRMRSSDGI